AGDHVEARYLVQEVSLQQLPPALVVLDAVGSPSPLIPLERYICRRLRWPDDAPALSPLVRELAHGHEFAPARDESLEELLSRRLLAQPPSLLPLLDRIALAATHEVTVLLNGETGCGKTFLARLIHEHSPRHQ